MNRPRMFVIGDTEREVEISISVLIGHAMIAISMIAVSAILFWVMRGNPHYVDALIAPVMSVIAAIYYYLDALSCCTRYRNTERQMDREINIMLNQEIAGLYAQLREAVKFTTDNENPYWSDAIESPSKQMEGKQ